MRAYILEQVFYATSGIYRKWKGRPAWGISTKELLAYPDGTLGKDMGEFLLREGLEPLSQSERHDVFHVLTGYSTSIAEEVELQYFLWGNRKKSLYLKSVLLAGLLFYPDRLKNFKIAFQRGRAARPFFDLDFKSMLTISTQEIRNEYRIDVRLNSVGRPFNEATTC